MNERELAELKDSPVPPPSADARDDAIRAALAAFDQRLTFVGSDEPQGLLHAARHTHASSNWKRSKSMRGIPFNYAMAASVAALMVAAPAAFYALKQGHDFSAEKTGAAGPGLVTADAAKRRPAQHDDARSLVLDNNNVLPTDKYSGYDRAGTAMPGEAGKAAPEPIPTEIEKREAAKQAEARRQRSEAEAWSRRALEERERLARAESETARAAQEIAAAQKTAPATTTAPSSGEANASANQPAQAPAKPDAKSKSVSTLAANLPPPPPSPTPRVMGRMALGEQSASAGTVPMPGYIAGLGADVARLDQYGRPTPADYQSPDPTEEFRDRFEVVQPSPVKRVSEEPVSTFSIDVDTASYGFVRRALNEGRLPPKDAVRIEEMINYFHYDYPAPESAAVPFKPTVTVFPAPWNADNRIVHVAIKGFEVKAAERPRANLVFLVDTSGSMAPPDRLPLVKNALRMLVDQLKPDDTIGMVTYASGSGIALEPTKVSDKVNILAAIDRLQAGGSTAGASGIEDAYRLAEAAFDKASVNRIILATDGDFNVGITDRDALKGFVERKRESGIFLSILGVGRGNYNDSLMQTLAQNGNGTAAYIDTLSEARKVLVDEASSTLFTIAKDVKIQLEFNPARVAEYRLIGYETRSLKREDFSNDKVDAGDIGSGHTVTAMYEVTPVGAPKLVEDLRYAQPGPTPTAATPEPAKGVSNEIGFLKLRYKLPNEQASKLTTLALDQGVEKSSINEAGNEVRFSTAVAAFGQLLRGVPYMKSFGYDDVIALANPAKGNDTFGYRAEFLNMVRLAKSAQP